MWVLTFDLQQNFTLQGRLLWLWLFVFEALIQSIFYQAGHGEHWLQNRSFSSSPPPRRALLPQPLLHDYTHICCPDATHPHPPCLQHPSLLQLPRSTCGCCSSTLFINSFLMLPDGTTVIYGGPSVFTFMSMCMCVRGSIKSMHSEQICLHMWLIISNGKCVILISLHLRLFGSILHTAFALTQE